MPYMYSEMQNKLSKTRDSPLESMGQIISSRCPENQKSAAAALARVVVTSLDFVVAVFDDMGDVSGGAPVVVFGGAIALSLPHHQSMQERL